MKSKFLEWAFRGMICTLPAALYFSYYPVISLGADETMNFELSLPLIWLVLFDVLVVILLMAKKRMTRIFKKWQLLLFPIFVTLSILWSMNMVRGLLTVLVMWSVVVAVAGVYLMRDLLKDEKFKKIFWRWFFGSALVICAWCVVQCILDVMTVSRINSLLCAGCTSYSFGFPHPNGFAIEPQFMGNLLLAPAIVSGWFMLRNATSPKYYAILFFIFVATLFLTFSRGAIYAFIVAMMFMTGFFAVKTKKWKAMMLWPIVIVAFFVALNVQGLLAQVSPTNDTYQSGVAKVLNHLSLGIIDVRVKKPETSSDEDEIMMSAGDAAFDGYVAESKEIRKMMTRNAIAVWSQNFGRMLFGVGIGGAGQAMYDAGLIESPKEIVQNEYASLLLEVGLVGVALLVFAGIVIVKLVLKNLMAPMVLTLMVAYGVTLVFFSGFANALQIYLLPIVLLML